MSTYYPCLEKYRSLSLNIIVTYTYVCLKKDLVP